MLEVVWLARAVSGLRSPEGVVLHPGAPYLCFGLI